MRSRRLARAMSACTKLSLMPGLMRNSALSSFLEVTGRRGDFVNMCALNAASRRGAPPPAPPLPLDSLLADL